MQINLFDLCPKREPREQRAEGRGQRAEGRGQRAEGRGQRAEGRGQRAEGRGQRLHIGLVDVVMHEFRECKVVQGADRA